MHKIGIMVSWFIGVVGGFLLATGGEYFDAGVVHILGSLAFLWLINKDYEKEERERIKREWELRDRLKGQTEQTRIYAESWMERDKEIEQYKAQIEQYKAESSRGDEREF